MFLTGSDADALEAQAKRLAERVTEQKKRGNVATTEGETKSIGTGDGEARDFASKLFGGSD